EPGAGKSRLLLDVAERAAADGLIVMRGRASEAGPAPLRVFAEALAGIQRRGLLPDEHLGGYRPLLSRVLPDLPGPDHGSTQDAVPLVAFAEAVLRTVTAVGGNGGCLLVLEDLQDADAESVAVLEYLLDNMAGAPVAVLGALRPEPGPIQQVLATAELRGTVELLPLRRLNQVNTCLLVQACLGSDRLSAELLDLAWRNSAGNPLVAEELLYDLVASGQLGRHGEGWQLTADPVLTPPRSVLQLIELRMARLDQRCRQVLLTAAIYGEQFPLQPVQAATGLAELDFLAAIGLGVTRQILVAEAVGWYRFHHPLTHTAVLELAEPAERHHAAGRLAEAVLAKNPSPTGTVCRLAGRLLAEAGRPEQAGELYARAGRRALRAGAVEYAVADLTEAIRLRELGGPVPADLVADLVPALCQAGRLDRASEWVERLDPPTDVQACRTRALMHLGLIPGCHNAGRTEQARRQLSYARSLVVGAGAELLRIHCDVMDARLSVDFTECTLDTDPAAERLALRSAVAAERLAETAADAVERAAAVEVACLAWNALLLLLRMHDRPREHVRYGRRLAALADRHNLAGWALYAALLSAKDQWMIDGDVLPLQAVCDQLQRLGQVQRSLMMDCDLYQHQLMVGEGSLQPVVEALTEQLLLARRLGEALMEQLLLAGLVLAAGLRADRRALSQLLANEAMADPPYSLAQEIGLASALCLALEARDHEAFATLADLARRKLIDPYYGSFALGLMLLLGTVMGRTSSEEVAAAFPLSGQVRWTRQFLHWASAIHAGRRGELGCAQRHASQATVAAAIYPVARHLAARLVAAEAAAAGWGTPIEDLRAAEAWFHEQDVPVAARSCRDVLRSLGASVPQRREGTAALPAVLRAAGVTAREYEVGLLVREHLANRDIGARLHISPRTVEKHVAALLGKLMLPDRRALIDVIAGSG
ncbi:MAG TPA: AAA family ATPase, partial [Jatrophihabitans sp.]|nr:AAA family ATPase [Jatrophihabitans sp.]